MFGKMTSVITALAIFAMVSPSGGNAQSGLAKLSSDNFYVVSLYSVDQKKPPFAGVFCPIKKNALAASRLGRLTKCERGERFGLGAIGLGSITVDHRKKFEGLPQMVVSYLKDPTFGRKYFTHFPGSDRSNIHPDGPTFYFDAAPATITVFPYPGQDHDEALKQASILMKANGYGSELDQFEFKLMRAAKISCTKKSTYPVCKLGGDIEYPKVGVIK